jgi:HupE / UreJ protein
MTEFELYLTEGIRHISDLGAYDHILFVTALCAIYQLAHWRRLLILVTAFTLGHSVTLALATLKLVSFRTELIEFLIPVTIVITCLINLRQAGQREPARGWARYLMALLFGLIHGLGFSNYLRSLLGKEASITLPLFAFNLGLELGQLLIVAVILLFTSLLINGFRVKPRDWALVLSGAVAGVAGTLLVATWPF